VYYYPYSAPYSFYNTSAGANQTKQVLCLCQEYTACGCDDNSNATFMNSVIGDGNPAQFNTSLVRVSAVNGSDTIVLNGTLLNGTETTSGASRIVGMGWNWMMGWLAISAVTFMVL
jgi:hypothetical protein